MLMFLVFIWEVPGGAISLLKLFMALGLVCSQTQLCHIGVFIDYIEQLHVSAFTGRL